MFECKVCKAKDKEIEFLRKQVNDLQDRLMALVGDALYKFNARDLAKQQVPPPVYVDILGQIQSMAAETEEEKKQKQQAIDEINEILGH
jgi:hypothetical protein